MDIYNTKIDCNYKSVEDDNDDLAYKKNIIEVFNLENDILNDDLFTMMNTKIDDLKIYLTNKGLYNKIEEFVKSASKVFLIEKDDIGLMMLFSYDYFDLFHKILVKLLEEEILDETIAEELREKLPK